MEWRPIESAPKDGTVILTANYPYLYMALAWRHKWGDGGWLADFGEEGWLPGSSNPTHWLPDPPTP